MSTLDNLQTPSFDFERIITKIHLGKPDIDLMSAKQSRKARRYIDKRKNIFKTELKGFKLAWLNSPHNIYSKVIPYIITQYHKHEFNIIILIPTNNARTSYWQSLIEPNNIFWNNKGFCYWYPYDKPIKFLKNGKHIMNKNGKPEHAHNAYNVLVLLKKINVKRFKERVRSWYDGKA